jgi:hypothetical protein
VSERLALWSRASEHEELERMPALIEHASVIGWIDFTSEPREKMRTVLAHQAVELHPRAVVLACQVGTLSWKAMRRVRRSKFSSLGFSVSAQAKEQVTIAV